MSDKTKRILRLTYFVCVSAALLVAAACLMVACVAIYRTGDHPFTREVVAQHFAPIAVPVFACLGLVVLGFVLHPLLPDAPVGKADLTAPMLQRLQARTDLTACPQELKAAATKERLARATHRWITLALLAVGAAAFLVYALDMNHFHQSEITASMIAAVKVMAVCFIPAFGYGVFAAYHRHHSMKAEIALLKTAPAEAVSPAPAPTAIKVRWALVARYAVLAVALFLITVGLLGDGWMDVLTKAINICTECIGLG